MPKELFFTIPKEKQERILEAALSEFSAKLYDEASINQIIKSASISRGSFYEYFLDKEDVYFFLVEKILHSKACEFQREHMGEGKRDVLLFYRKLFIYKLKLLSDEKYKYFMKNVYLSMTFDFQQKFQKILNELKMNAISNEIHTKVSELQGEDRYLFELINILELINRNLINVKVANDLDDKRILEIYDMRIHVLCNINTYVNAMNMDRDINKNTYL